MAQHDYNIANQTGANFRTDLNNALLAISSNNSGSSEPSTMYAYEWWIDTSSNVLKLRNSSNNAWITMPFSITADNTVDINAGTVNGITSLSFSSGATVTSILDEDNFSSDSATALATQQSIKAYIASQITLEDLDITDGSSSISIDLDSETLSLLGGTGVTSTASGNGVTFAIGQSVGTSDNVVFNQVTGALVGNASTATALATARTISGVSFDGTANITLDTDDIGEGSSNLYYTDARVQAISINNVVEDTTPQLGGNLDVNGQDIVSVSNGNITLTPNGTGLVRIDGSNGVDIQQGSIKIKNGGTQSYIDFYCESANAHYLRLQAPPHSAFSGNPTVTLPNTAGTIALTSSNISGNSATASQLETARAIALAGDIVGTANFDGSAGISITTTIQPNSVALATDTTGNFVAGITGTTNEIEVSGSGSENATVTIGLPDDVTVSNDLTVSGNLTVTGSTTQIGSVITDSNFQGFTDNNTGNVTDFGFYGKYVESSTTKYAGLFYDASTDNTFRLFTDTETKPSTTVNTGATGYTVAALIANLTGNVTGNADTATALATGRTIALSGDVTASGVSFDGTGDITLSTTIASNSVALGSDTTGNYVATIAGTTNEIEVVGSGSETATVTIGLPDDVTIAGNLTVNGTTTTVNSDNLAVTDPLIKLAKSNSGADSLDIGFYGLYDTSGSQDLYAGLFRDANDSGKFKLFKDLQDEPTTTVNTSGTGYAVGTLVSNLEGNVTGNVTGQVSTLSNHDTDNLSEGSSNLYFTNARSRSAISASGDISYNSSTGVISFTQSASPVTSVNSATGAVVLNTDDIAEGSSNLYFTNARADTRINLQTGANLDLSSKSTSNLSEGTNLYYTDARFDTRLGTKTTDNLTEGSSNLYMTTERVQDIVGGMVTGNTETGITVTYDDSDGTLDFVVGILNQDTTGNAATATALATGRNFSISGDITASAVSFDGTGNVDLSASIDANTVGISELNVSDGSNGQVLTTDGAGNLSFSTASGTTINNNADNRVITGSGSANTLNGESGFTYDGSALSVTGTINGISILADTTNFTDSILISQNASTGTLDAATNNTGLGDTVFAALTSGDNNVGIGADSLKALTSGSGNVGVGFATLEANTTADNNTAVGFTALLVNTTGHSNVAVGSGALDANTTASENTAMGHNSLSANTTGAENTALGQNALLTNTTGSFNVSVGKSSLASNTTASENTAVGKNSLGANTTGGLNTGIGASALSSNTTGQYNTAVGGQALQANTTASNNTAVGLNALLSNTTGTLNTAVGATALDAITTNSYNTAVGTNALSASTADFNTGFGANAGKLITTGTENVALGGNALDATTTGSYNTAVGTSALGSNTTASNNTAVGVNALLANTTGTSNIAVGVQALSSATTASNNVAVGANALSATTTGYRNTAIGDQAMESADTSFSVAVGYEALATSDQNANVAIGYHAMDASTGADSCVAVGTQCLRNVTGDDNTGMGRYCLDAQTSASHNVAMGYQAGTEITTGGSNVIVGSMAAVAATTADTSVIIGYDAGSSITSAGNNVIIGSSAGDDLTTGGQNVVIGKLNDAGAAGSVGRVVLGYSATGATNNSITVGYGSTDSALVFGGTSWYTPSDERLKEDIQDEKIGLDFINDLRPVTFRWKKAKDVPQELNCYEDSEERVMNGKYNHGFIAQEVKETINNHNLKEGFGLWMEDDADGRQRVGDASLMPLMVKAIQELSKQLDELKSQINKGE